MYSESEAPKLSPAEAIDRMSIKLDKRSTIFQTLNGVLGKFCPLYCVLNESCVLLSSSQTYILLTITWVYHSSRSS